MSARAGLKAAAIAVALAAALSACKGPDPAQAQAQKPGKPEEAAVDAVPVEVVPASRRAIAASYTGTAALEPRAESQVVAKTSGVALEVLVEEGQHVKAGQPLVRLDPDRARLAVAQAEAQLRKLENNYHRARQLAEQQLISAGEVDQMRYDLENARAHYNMTRLELSYTTVVAPISGVVASRSIKAGNFVQINTPIFRIVDTSRLEATLNVPERELSTLKAGQPVSLQVDALPGRTFQGVVDRVAPVVDSGSGTFRVVCAFAGDDGLQPGMFGRLRIDYDQRADALVVPRVALLDDQAEPAVYTVRDSKAVRVPVKLGYSDGEWSEIRDGLEEGEPVVTAGKVALRDGSVVHVIGGSDGMAGKATAAASAGSRQ
ncbi:efflux transporter periplasmic adaptor subunit [Pseudoxanthomonas taiwanensis]|uniref:Efflux transporter periplasmic adaptor subunit n=2 Tax=Pseudoxanthomonas taiwanensis TaxID=176598 RepID=A0A921P5T4_9GAMM|nr:efflux RND transporter periplasmic adaptor subunit [Pseudoxanthomonas taiwanensis]KAF1690475.1 efflux transporter periplasmic adaptor subunit [Pseudoxanthomonas taiwanensis]